MSLVCLHFIFIPFFNPFYNLVQFSTHLAYFLQLSSFTAPHTLYLCLYSLALSQKSNLVFYSFLAPFSLASEERIHSSSSRFIIFLPDSLFIISFALARFFDSCAYACVDMNSRQMRIQVTYKLKKLRK